jgi:ABC-2 type transport system ATP-binding protein
VVPEADAVALYVEDGSGSIAEIVRRLELDEIRVGAITVARPSLDDVFLKATGRRLEGQEQSQAGTEVTT